MCATCTKSSCTQRPSGPVSWPERARRGKGRIYCSTVLMYLAPASKQATLKLQQKKAHQVTGVSGVVGACVTMVRPGQLVLICTAAKVRVTVCGQDLKRC